MDNAGHTMKYKHHTYGFKHQNFKDTVYLCILDKGLLIDSGSQSLKEGCSAQCLGDYHFPPIFTSHYFLVKIPLLIVKSGQYLAA